MITTLFSKILSILFPERCYGCQREGISLCDSCLSTSKRPLSLPYPFIISRYSFKSAVIRRSIHAIKYFHRKDLLLPLGKRVAEEIIEHKLSGILIPIPMHPLRQMMRGYNQAEALATIVAHTTSLPFSPTVLKRRFLLKQQVKTASRKERLRNQRKAFSIEENVQGKDFILIDDVITTGATLLSARKALLEKGARNVWAVTIAH